MKRPPRAPDCKRWSGNAAELAGDTLAFYDRCEREHGGILATHVWGLPVWLVFDPAAIEEVLVRQHRAFAKSVGLRSTVRAFGDGLLTSDKQLWRRQRRIIQPTFQPRRLEIYATEIQRATARMIERIRPGEPRNLHADVTELCFEALTQAMFGEDVAEAKDVLAAAAEALHGFHDHYSRRVGGVSGVLFSAFRRAVTRLGKPDFRVDPTFVPTAHARAFRSVMRELDRFVYALIARRRRAPGDETDLVTSLLSARDEQGRPLDERQIRDEVVTMFLAGHETGAAAISWAVYLLAEHPACRATLHQELDAALGDVFPDQRALESLPYLKRVLSESLRLYPPAYRISRTSLRRATLGAFTIEPGTEVVISQWSVHRSARYYDAPHEFRPERWTPELRAALPRFAWFPFGGGPRTCIGDSFALMESGIVVAALARAFEFELAPDARVRPFQGVTLLPERNDIRMILKRRRPERRLRSG
jgi:cytochrome P450